MDDDALYDLPPQDFTGARNELVKDLRAAGDRDGAGEVADLRRPSAAAWAVNQVARRDPDLLAELIGAGEELVREQRRALSGVERADLRGATARRREALDVATRAAATHHSGIGSEPTAHLDRVAATLEAASIDPVAADEVRRGRLERELPAPSGIEGLGLEGLSVVPDRKPSRSRPKGGAGAGNAAEEQEAPSREAVAAEAARRAAESSRERAEAARAERERAQIRSDEAAGAVERAREELRRAEVRAAETAGAREEAARAAEEAAQAAAGAEADAEDLAEDARRAAARSR